MPNTEPVVDSAAVLGSLDRAARARGARCRSASSPRSRRARRASELTEMAELADAGAAGFSDDGRPVVSRRADAPRAPVRTRSPAAALALHCEEPTLSRGGQMHEGAVSAELGFAGYPSVAESVMVERDLALAALRGAAAPPAAPLGARVGRGAAPRAQAAGVARDRRGRRRTTSASPTRPCARSTRT